MATPADTTAPVLSDEEKAQKFNALPEMIQEAVNNLNAEIDQHNANVQVVRQASQEKKSETDTVFELIEKDDHGDKVLSKIWADVKAAEERVEKLRLQALKRANEVELKPKDVSADEATAAHEATKVSSKELRDKRDALSKLEDFFKVDLSIFLKEIDSTRGLRLNASESGEKITRPQYKALYIVDENGTKELISKEVDTKDGKVQRSTTTQLASELTKRGGKGFSVSSSEITTAFLKNLGYGPDGFSKVTSGQEIAWSFSKDAVDSEGNNLGAKKFDLVFVK